MFDIIIEFFKATGEWGLIAFGIAFGCIAITFITLTGFIVFVFVSKTVWTSLFGGTKSSEPIQYALLKRFLFPILMNGGKDLGKTIMDTLESKSDMKPIQKSKVKAENKYAKDEH